MLVLEGLVDFNRTIELQLLQHYWSGHRLGLWWYWMVCLGKKQRPLWHFFFFLDSSFFFYCSGFCHTLKWNSHGFTCIPHPDPPSHLPLDPIPLGLTVHQVQALVSCIQPGLVISFTLDNIYVSMLSSWNIPPSPSPTESKWLFYKSVSLFLFCI